MNCPSACSYPALAAALAVLAGSLPVAGWAEVAADYTHFETHIRPLLAEQCYECHSSGAKRIKANLVLDSRAGWQTGGDSGPAIIPGKPDESLLLQAVSHTHGDLKMPPKKRLAKKHVEALRRWIEQGAPDPREGEAVAARSEIDLAQGRTFWAFRPPVAPEIPAIQQASWPANDIDRFILARLESEGIAPADPAPPRTWLRRAHYDLTGLPPSPEEIAAFLTDSSPAARAAVIDELLSRPEFGERWGRHWLDVTRFAESSGGGRSLVFPHAWRFRDYVIDAFNTDKPFDQFIREHIAGDVLPFTSDAERHSQLIGSGYLVLGPINYELQDNELLRMELVDEQIDTVGRTFLGMTLGCARCHDHKFDPIPITDYYALAGIFQSTESLGKGSAASGVSSPATVQVTPTDSSAWKQMQARHDAAQKRLAELNSLLAGPKKKGSIDPKSLPGIVVDSAEARLSGTWQSSVYTGSWIGKDYIHDKDQPKGKLRATFSATPTRTEDLEVLVSYSNGSGRSPSVPVTIHHANGTATTTIDQTKQTDRFGCFVSVGTYPFSPERPASVTLTNEGTEGVVIVDAVLFVQPQAAAPDLVDRKAVTKERDALKKKLAQLAAELKTLSPTIMAASEVAQPADGHVLIRGQVRNKGPRVPRGFITVASPPHTPVAIAPRSSGRMELASWIADPSHPLTARVYVNRVWKHLMGRGIVPTPDNFGTTGERPTHPALLDHLATTFVQDGWSTKRLIRSIMLSRTYGLSSQGDASHDPGNRLYGRANRKPQDAESIRDTILLVSGQLDRTRGGMTIRNPGKYDLNYRFQTHRRSVYVPWFRNSILDLFEVFDAANPNLVVGKRPTTTLPTQALFLMNSSFVREQARHTAQRIIKQGSSLTYATELILGRPPTPAEHRTLSGFLHRFPEDQQEEAWTQVCQSLFACIDFRYLN